MRHNDCNAVTGQSIFRRGNHPLIHEEGTLVYDKQLSAWQAAQAAADIRGSDRVQDVLAARLDRLATEDKQVAQHAAIIGRTFWQHLLSDIIKMEL